MYQALPPLFKQRSRANTLAALLLTASILCVAAHGADTNGTKPEARNNLMDMDLDTLAKVEVRNITTASKKTEKATAAPGTVQVITANDIYLRGYTTLTDVLRDLPGMEVTPFFFSEQGTAVTVRGVQGNNKLVVLVNGMRVNPPGGEWLPLRSDFFVKNAEQIEVVYGPGSTLYGADAINGVINIKTKDPVNTPTVDAGADYGTDNTRNIYGSINHVFDPDHGVKFSGFFGYHDSELTPLDREYPKWWGTIAEDAQKAGGIGLVPYRQDFGLNGFGRIEGYNSSFQVWHRQSVRSSSEGGYPDGYLPAARWDDSSTALELRNKLRLGDKYALEHIVTYNRYEIDPSTRYVWRASTADTWAPNDYKYGRGEELSFEQIHTYEVNDKLDFLAGAVGGIFDVIPKATVAGGANPRGNVVSQGGTFTYTNSAGEANTIQAVNEIKYHTIGGYGEAHYQVLDPLKLVAGARIDTDSRFPTTPVTPRAAVIYDITKELTAKYSYAKAFVQPASYFAYNVYDNGRLLAISNPDLQPESGETHEINLTYTKANLTLSGSAYWGMQENLILVSDSGNSINVLDRSVNVPGGTRTLVHTVNSGESQNHGIDLSGRAKFGSISPWVSYSYVHFETKRNGAILSMTGVSAHNGRLGLTWIPISKLSITPSLMIRSEPENISWLRGTEGSMHTLPYQVDLFGLYHVTKNLDIYAKITNLTDNHYGLPNITGWEAPQETIEGSAGLMIRF